MPSFNRAHSISTAIESVIKQTHTNFELIIIDDGSTDNTKEVINRFLEDKRVNYNRIIKSGVSVARNRGLELAKGDIVFFLDSDNAWDENFLRVMIAFMIHGNLVAGYCGIKMHYENENVLSYRGDDFLWKECLRENYIDMNAFCHKRGLQKKIRFDESLRRMVDWDYILAVTAIHSTSYAPFYGVQYYDGYSGNRISNTEYKEWNELNDLQNMIRAKHIKKEMSAHERGKSIHWSKTVS